MAIENSIAYRVCISHFLSAWNSRIFEYSAVLFLASIFPGTLLPPSCYAMFRALSAIFLAPSVGRRVDSTNRLVTVRQSIMYQRSSVALSCALLIAMIWLSVGEASTGIWIKIAFMLGLVLLACIEKLALIMNTVSVERDWVVVIAGSNSDDLRTLNSIMRRIDLFCKMGGPLAISFLIGFSIVGSIVTVLILNLVSVVIEYVSIARVYRLVPALAYRVEVATEEHAEDLGIVLEQQQDEGEEESLGRSTRFYRSSSFSRAVNAFSSPLQIYINHDQFIPSFSLAILYFTVLSFGGQMVAYLLAMDYHPGTIGVLRTFSVVFELGATWLAPLVMKKIGVVRGGIWFINWQAICCVIAAISIFKASPTALSDHKVFYFFSSTSTALLIFAVVFSRVGLWGYDLCAQVLIQEGVEQEARSTFSSVESSFQNFFELLSFASTIVFDKPNVFKIPVALSANSVVIAAVLYAVYVRRVRKHLLHLPLEACFGLKARNQILATVEEEQLDEFTD
ncbi:Ferroporti-1 [Lipomyces japonicus]|uniref:Ferroporti-1 n=1 Tax=Lipomyces japonicus TaxID=56871 RepID=UPI0034CD650D